MARVKRAMQKRTRLKNLFNRVKGFFLGHRLLRQAKEARMRAEKRAYIGRKQKKRQYRRLWTQRINAGVRAHGLSYSKFAYALRLSGIAVNRKVLADLALNEPAVFEAIVKKARASLPA